MKFQKITVKNLNILLKFSFKPINQLKYFSTEEVKNKKAYWESKFNINRKTIKTSSIRSLDIGNNFFRFTNPRKKKILVTLYNSYIDVLQDMDIHNRSSKSLESFYSALNLFYNNKMNNKEFSTLSRQELDLEEDILNHIYSITMLEKLSNQFSRIDYTDYHHIIKDLNNIKKEDRNKAKFVFTSHPTQPNTSDQICAIQEILRALEENDLDYLRNSMKAFILATTTRIFKKPSYIEESKIYHSMAIRNIIGSASLLYDSGFKDPQDFFEIPGTWITYDFDNHPETSLGIMTYTNGLCLELTINCYVKIILEANILENEAIQQLLEIFQSIVNYSRKIREVSELIRSNKIDLNEFENMIPVFNIYELENQVLDILEIISENKENYKLKYTAEKLLKIIKLYRFNTCMGQIRFAGEELYDLNDISKMINGIFKEISILNKNIQSVDMIIIANYVTDHQYKNIQTLLEKNNIQNIEIVPLLETFSATNDTDSKITMIAGSDTRQRDGLLLTELRTLREYTTNPKKFIYMGQGITAERGGGPYDLIHKKFQALTESQRKRHIRTIQGYYFCGEYASRDLVFVHSLNASCFINMGSSFTPTTEYMDFLFDLDSTVGVPCRIMQKTSEYNDLYVKNNYIKTMVDLYDFAGSRELGKKLDKVKNCRAIVQAFINSDRCSYTHPELGFWNELTPEQIKNITKFYYDNNKHWKYILFNLGFMVKRYDLKISKNILGIDYNNNCFKAYEKGKKSLDKLLTNLGVGQDSTPIIEIYKQHLGLSKFCSMDELNQKEIIFKTIYKIQIDQIDRYLKEEDIIKKQQYEKKIKLVLCILSNFSQFNGKG